MRRSFIFILTLTLTLFYPIHAQKRWTEFVYNDVLYSLKVSPDDSTMSFYEANAEKIGEYASEADLRYDGRIRVLQYLTRKKMICDSIANSKNIDLKRSYINYRVSTLNELIGLCDELKNMKGEKVIGTKYDRLYKDLFLFPSYYDESSLDDDIKMRSAEDYKVTGSIIKTIPLFVSQLENEKDNLKRISKLSLKDFLRTPIPEPTTGVGLNGYWPRTEFREDYVFQLNEREIEEPYKNPCLSDRKITLINPFYYGIGYVEWKWLTGLDKETLTLVERTYPEKVRYYKSEQYQGFRFYEYDGDGIYVCDQTGKLIGVNMLSCNSYRLMVEIQKYQFEHNAYNVQAESKQVKDAIKKELYGTECNMPSFDDQMRATDFLEQISKDFEYVNQYDYYTSERIDGITSRIRTIDGKFSCIVKAQLLSNGGIYYNYQLEKMSLEPHNQ